MRRIICISTLLIAAVVGMFGQNQPRQLPCVVVPTQVRASSVHVGEGELALALKSALQSTGMCSVHELTGDTQPDTLFVLSSITKATQFDIHGPFLNGHNLNQANFDVTAQVSVVNLAAGQVLYQRSVVGESQFDGIPSATDIAAFYQKAAVGALKEAVRRLASEYRPISESGKVVRRTADRVIVNLGRKHGIGLQRLEVIGADGHEIGLLDVKVAEAEYSICSLKGNAPEGALVRAVGANSLTTGTRPKYAVLPVKLPESLLRYGIDPERAADSLQSALFTGNSLTMLAPIYSDDLLRGQDFLEKRTSAGSLQVKNVREQPDGFIEAAVTEASIGRQQSDTGTRYIFRVFVQVRLIDGVTRQVHAQFYRTETHDEVVKPGIREIDPENPVYFIDLIDKVFRGVADDLKAKDVSVPLRGQIANSATNAFDVRFDGVSRCSPGQSFSVLRSDGALSYPELRVIGLGKMLSSGANCIATPGVALVPFQPGDLVRADYQYNLTSFANSSLLFSVKGDTDAAPYMNAALGDLLPVVAESDPWLQAGELFDRPEVPFENVSNCRASFSFHHDPPASVQGGVALRSVGTLDFEGQGCYLKSQRVGNTVTVQWKSALNEVPYDFYRGQAVRAIAFELVKRAVRNSQVVQ